MTGRMSAPTGEQANEEAGTENLVKLFDNINQDKTQESRKPGIFTYLIRNPLMAGGMAATGYYMFKGIRAASSGESYNLAEMLQKRVVGQFGTLIVIIGSFTYFVMRDPNATKRAEVEAHSISQRALQNYNEAQARKG
ncbi:hypothetical protein ACHWQZ_G007422 [Mnemiopsis leidyi]